MTKRRALIEHTISDMVSDFLYYDRKDDEELSGDDIEDALNAGEITIEQMVECFRKELEEGLSG